MAESIALVKTVVEVLHDGEKGFLDIGEHLKDAQLKAYFMHEAQTRRTFADQLEGELAAYTDDASNIGGTAAGTVHRVWGDIKAHLGGNDHTLLETAEQGEDAAKKAYKEALSDSSIPAALLQLLITQQTHIQASHDKVKAFRDSTPS